MHLRIYVKSLISFHEKDYPAAIAAAAMEASLDPNSAYGYFALGQAEHPLGQCEQSIEHIKRAFLLDPRDPSSGLWHMNLGLAEVCRGRQEQAIEELKRSIDAGYRPYIPYAVLAGVEASNGDDAAAKSALAEARRLNPLLTLKWLQAAAVMPPSVIDALRKAGLPED